MNNHPSEYNQNEWVYITSDSHGYFHGVGDNRKAKIMFIHPLPEQDTYEYELQDENGDFWFVPENDLSRSQ